MAPVNPDFGFSDNSVRVGLVSLEDNVRLTEGLGAGLLRLDLDWRAVEPRRGEYHFEDYDRIYEAVLAAGIRPLLMIGYAPSWAWDPLSLCQGSCHYPPHPRWYGSWRQVVAAAVHRYPRAAGIEIWNEPNALGFWHSGPDPVRYTQLLAEAHRAVKGVDPSFPVISGGLANGFHDAPSGRSMRGFLHDMYVAGAKGYLDGIGFHPYPGGNSFQWLEGSLEAVRAVRDAADPGRPLWATETGLSTTGTDPLLVVTEAEQAAALVRLVRLLRDQPDVKAVLIHSLIERPGAATDRETGFGVVRPDLRPKPAYCMLAAALGGKPCSG